MPDVICGYNGSIARDGRFVAGRSSGTIQNHIKEFVAEQMDCLDDNGRVLVHSWRTHITVIAFGPAALAEGKLFAMQVFAYDWPDRMATIDDRLSRIGISVRDLLELPEDSVDVSFIKIQRPTATQRACWVNV